MSFTVLSSMAIPYSAHTCLVSQQTHIQFMGLEDDCDTPIHDNQTNYPTVKKSKCCLVNNGLIDVDLELVFSSLNTFIAFTPVQIKTFKPYIVLDTPSNKKTIYIAHNREEIPIRIMQQSFLC